MAADPFAVARVIWRMVSQERVSLKMLSTSRIRLARSFAQLSLGSSERRRAPATTPASCSRTPARQKMLFPDPNPGSLIKQPAPNLLFGGIELAHILVKNEVVK